MYSRVDDRLDISLSDALDALDSGSYDLARELAADLRTEHDLPAEEQGGPAYVLGVAMFHDAEKRWALTPNEARALYLLSARYLDEASETGFPTGREGHASYLLGRARYTTGQFAASLAPLLSALQQFPEQQSEIHRLLANAYLQDTVSDPALALGHIQEYLEDDSIVGDARQRSLLTAAEIQFKMGALDDCAETLQQISGEAVKYAAAARLIEGRMRMRRADEDALFGNVEPQLIVEAYEQALKDFREGQDTNPTNSELVRKAKYLQGIAAKKLQRYEEAEQHFSLTRHANYDTAEGLAAGFEEAEVMRILGKHEEAIRAYSRVLRQALDMPVYSNAWITLEELRTRSEAAYKEYFVSGDFAHAIQMANALTPLSSEENALEMQANAYRAEANSLQRRADSEPPSSAAKWQADALAAWRKAAALYEQLARVRFATRQYPDTIWKGAESYLNGHDYRRAARLLRIYLNNQIRRQHPPALTALGEAELALGGPDKALIPLTECIEFFPQDPHSYQARLLAAEANRELGKLDRAKELLRENLEDGGLVPSSTEWRESLYALGKIYFREGMQHETAARLLNVDSPDQKQRKDGFKELELANEAFQNVILRLSEAVERDEIRDRDPHALQMLEARYLIAESHRQAAKLPLRKIGGVTIEPTRNDLSAQIQAELTAAVTGYSALQDMLNDKQAVTELTSHEEQMLRNTYFALADAYYDLESYEDAIRAYATATNRYQNEPEALEAYVQIANCHRQLNRHAEARGTLEQAKVVLNRIRPDADFTRTTRYDRNDWQVLLDWLITL